jgi:hypothetical protein
LQIRLQSHRSAWHRILKVLTCLKKQSLPNTEGLEPLVLSLAKPGCCALSGLQIGAVGLSRLWPNSQFLSRKGCDDLPEQASIDRAKRISSMAVGTTLTSGTNFKRSAYRSRADEPLQSLEVRLVP